MWNPASITDMMSDDLDITEVVVLDHLMAILCVGCQLVGEGLTEGKAQACIKHFSPYIEWRDMAVEQEFQAMTLAEAREEIQAYEAQSHSSIQGRGHPKTMKLSSLRFIKARMGLDYSPNEFQGMRGKNQRSHCHDGSQYFSEKGDPGPK